MDVEIVVPVPVPAIHFNFDTACSTPYRSAPSSPQRFGNFFYSAPSSPTTRSGFLSASSSSSSMMIPFSWEEIPGIPKTNIAKNGTFDGSDYHDGDFAFDFSGQLGKTYVSADELFDKGKIKPLKPPPRLQISNGGFGESEPDFNDSVSCKSAVSSPRSPISQGKKMIKEAFSPRGRRRPLSDFDPFEEAWKETLQETEFDKQQQKQQRGRERISETSSNSKFVRKKTRSLSPFRFSDILYGHDQDKTTSTAATASSPTNAASPANSFFSSFSFSRAYRKLKLKDLLLFRSASEGRATSTESEFQSTDSVCGSVGGGSVSRRRGVPPFSAHELNYTVKRAVSEELRRKTFLTYKQGLLGCLGFNPPISQRGGGSMTRV